MILITDLGLDSFFFFCKDQSLAEDFIPGSTDEEDIDGNLSSTKSDVKRGKKPEKMARIEKKQPTKGRYTP